MTPQKPNFIFQSWQVNECQSVLESVHSPMPRLLNVGKIKFRTFCGKPPTRFYSIKFYQTNI